VGVETVLVLKAGAGVEPSDVKKIEEACGRALPRAYRHLLLNFPIRADRGNSDGPLWDDAERLIQENRKMRERIIKRSKDGKGLAAAYWMIGDSGAGSVYLINLDEPTPVVEQMDFEDLATLAPDLESGAACDLYAWMHVFMKGLTEDGIDVHSEKTKKSGGFGYWVTLVVIFLLILIGAALLRWRLH
jgi:hypothetical protein